MTGKLIVVVSVLMLMGTVLVGMSQAAGLDQSGAIEPVGVSQSEALGQIQIATPTPMPVVSEDESPIQSEVGRAVGLVIGATILVLIVLAGLLIRRTHIPAARPRD